MKRMIYMKKKTKVMVVTVLVILLVLSLLMILKSVMLVDPVQSEVAKYNYSITPTVDYQVNLEKNDYINSSSLPAGEVYIHNIVKDIDVYFNIMVDGAEISDISITGGTYNELQGLMSAENEKSTVLWKRDYQMEAETCNTTNNATYHATVVLGDYELDAALAEDQLGYKGETSLQVICDGFVSFEAEGEKMSEPFQYSLTIPLNSATFTIDTGENEPIEQCMTENISTAGIRNTAEIIKFSLMSFIFLIILILVIKKSVEPSSEYCFQKKIKKEIKSSGKVIMLSREPIAKVNQGTEVTNLENLIELSHQLQQPILNFRQKYYVFDERNQFWCKVQNPESK